VRRKEFWVVDSRQVWRSRDGPEGQEAARNSRGWLIVGCTCAESCAADLDMHLGWASEWHLSPGIAHHHTACHCVTQRACCGRPRSDDGRRRSAASGHVKFLAAVV
jgi:hypothetical protein